MSEALTTILISYIIILAILLRKGIFVTMQLVLSTFPLRILIQLCNCCFVYIFIFSRSIRNHDQGCN